MTGTFSYTVQAGDSLSRIALQTYGDAMAYKVIADANNIVAPYTIYPGQVIQVPEPLSFVTITSQRIPDAANPAPLATPPVTQPSQQPLPPSTPVSLPTTPLPEITVTASKMGPLLVVAGILALVLLTEKKKR